MNENQKDFFRKIKLNYWFIRLRWIACFITFLLVLFSFKVFDFLPDKNFWYLIALVVVLAITNIIYLWLLKKKILLAQLKEIQIIADLIILTLMVQFSGGIENPLSYIYIIHVILSGILLDRKKSYLIVALAFVLYSSVAVGEMTEIIPHYSLTIYPHTETANNDSSTMDVEELHHHSHELSIHSAHYPPYVWSMIALNFFLMGFTGYFITEIMENLRTEQNKTKETYQKLEYVLKATNAGLVLLDKNLNVVWYNEPIKYWSGIKLKENNNSVSTIDNWVSSEKIFAKKIINDKTIKSIERKKIDKKGNIQYFQFTIAPLINTDGEVYQIAELIQDISQKKIIESELLHTSEMVTLGTMAASIVHEVGNPLSSISTRLKLLETEHEPNYISKSVIMLQNEIDRIKRILMNISQFGRYKEAQWELCNVNEILSETIEILKYHKSAKNHKIRSYFDSQITNIIGIKDQLKQVFLNIGLNALQALQDKGKLQIISKLEQGYVTISFIDNGTGIKKENKQKIQQLFFSTKKGSSGLGLFIANYFIKTHSGKIDIENRPVKGTKVKISLPINRSRNVMLKGEI